MYCKEHKIDALYNCNIFSSFDIVFIVCYEVYSCIICLLIYFSQAESRKNFYVMIACNDVNLPSIIILSNPTQKIIHNLKWYLMNPLEFGKICIFLSSWMKLQLLIRNMAHAKSLSPMLSSEFMAERFGDLHRHAWSARDRARDAHADQDVLVGLQVS